MDAQQRLMYWLLEGTKGGPTRVRLLALLAKKPANAHRLAISSGLDYRTVEHHLKLLTQNMLVQSIGNGYGKAYCVHDDVLRSQEFRKLVGGESNGKKK